MTRVFDASYTGRRLRISTEPTNLIGSTVVVADAETGKRLSNICKLVITLEPNSINTVEVTYYASTESEGILVGENGEAMRQTVNSQSPVVRIDAMEVRHESAEF